MPAPPPSTVLQWNDWFIGIGIHDAILVMPPVPCKLVHISFGIPFLGINGLWLGSLPSIDDEQMYGPDGLTLMGRTNDAGLIVPHVSIPPNNVLLPLTILFGSSNSILGSSRDKIPVRNLLFGADQADIACCIPGTSIAINVGCQDWLPLFGFDVAFATSNESVTLTWADLWAVLIDLAIEIAMAGLFQYGGKMLGGAKGLFKKAPGGASGKAVKGPVKKVKSSLGKLKASVSSSPQLMSESVEGFLKKLKKKSKKVDDQAVAGAREMGEKVAKDASEASVEKQLKDVNTLKLGEKLKISFGEIGQPFSMLKPGTQKKMRDAASKAAREAGDEATQKALKSAGLEGIDAGKLAAKREAAERMKRQSDEALEAARRQGSDRIDFYEGRARRSAEEFQRLDDAARIREGIKSGVEEVVGDWKLPWRSQPAIRALGRKLFQIARVKAVEAGFSYSVGEAAEGDDEPTAAAPDFTTQDAQRGAAWWPDFERWMNGSAPATQGWFAGFQGPKRAPGGGEDPASKTKSGKPAAEPPLGLTDLSQQDQKAIKTGRRIVANQRKHSTRGGGPAPETTAANDDSPQRGKTSAGDRIHRRT